MSGYGTDIFHFIYYILLLFCVFFKHFLKSIAEPTYCSLQLVQLITYITFIQLQLKSLLI